MNFRLNLFICYALLNGCQPYKAKTYQSTAARGSSGPVNQDGTPAGPSTPTEKTTELVLATDKLKASPGPYKAVIRMNKATSEQEFTPTGADVRLQLSGFPANEPGVLTVEIFQDGKMKFLAKRANTKLEQTQANRVVVDSCLILPSPWTGSQHDGSCEWNIADK